MDAGGRRYWIWLSRIDGIGPIAFKKLMNVYGNPEAVFREARDGRSLPLLGMKASAGMAALCSEESVDTMLQELEDKRITAICQCDAQYPDSLLGIYDPPFVLYAKGNASLLRNKHMISMVGTRNPTRYGEQAASIIAQGLARSGVTIVSGLARGIDGICHRACLDAGGETVAVLGCGADIAYPRENRDLYEEIIAKGLIVTEYDPGTPPAPGNFPARNRIISGLSSGTVVVEAGRRSGTLFTVDYALDQAREIFAVPGNINSPMSFTPNNLIKSGCQVASAPEDILEYYGWVRRSGPTEETPRIKPVSREEETVLDMLEDGQMTFDQIFERTDYSVPQLASILSMMEIKGMIVQLPGRCYSL